MAIAFIGLGSNLGQREKSIAAALNALQRTRDVSVEATSSLYETEPVGGPAGQSNYINAVVKLKTTLSPKRLLALLQQIEASLGRRREERWGPRTIDLDLLLYGDKIISEEGLIVPHPLMHERKFVMEPLVEIAPDVVHPALQQTARALLETVDMPGAQGED